MLTDGKTDKWEDEPEDLLMTARTKSCDRQEGNNLVNKISIDFETEVCVSRDFSSTMVSYYGH